MTGPHNTLRRLVIDGAPVVTGLHAIGDSVCTTNPTFGRGLSLAVWGASDLTDIIDKHADNWAQQAVALDERIARHVAPYYEEQAAVDSARLAMLRHTIQGGPPPPPPTLDADRTTFTRLRAAASFDPAAFRAFWKLMFMLCHPDEVYRDPQVVAGVHDALRCRGEENPVVGQALFGPERGHVDRQVGQPTRQQLAEALARI